MNILHKNLVVFFFHFSCDVLEDLKKNPVVGGTKPKTKASSNIKPQVKMHRITHDVPANNPQFTDTLGLNFETNLREPEVFFNQL